MGLQKFKNSKNVSISSSFAKNINATDSKGRTLLYSAVQDGDIDLVRYLLENGADPDIPDNTLTFPIHEAIDSALFDILEVLVDFDCSVNSKNLLGQTPLIRATIFGDMNAVKLLIKAGADLDETDCHGKTALLNGLREGSDKICCQLIRYGCDVNIVDSQGHSALFVAVHRSNEPSLTMCQKLYRAGYDFENDCSWLCKDLHKAIICTRPVKNVLRKLGLQKIKLDYADFERDFSQIVFADSCAQMT